MNRRAFLGTIGAASTGLAGCLDWSDEANSPEKVESEGDDDCPLVLDVSYHPPSQHPSSAEDSRLPYIDAEEAELRENEYLAQVLSEAGERYEERKEKVREEYEEQREEFCEEYEEQEDEGECPPPYDSAREQPFPLLTDRALADSAEVREKLGMEPYHEPSRGGSAHRAYVEDGDLTYTFYYGRDHTDCRGRDREDETIETYHRVSVYYPAEEPSEDDTVVDAEETGVTEHEYLSYIFEEAHTEYERREDELQENNDRTELFEDRDSELSPSNLGDKLDVESPVRVYVEYKSVTFRLEADTQQVKKAD